MVLRNGMAAEIDAVVVLHQRNIEKALLSGFMGLELGFQLLVSLDTLLARTVGLDQGVGIAALPFMALSQRFKNVHGNSSVRLRTVVLLPRPAAASAVPLCAGNKHRSIRFFHNLCRFL